MFYRMSYQVVMTVASFKIARCIKWQPIIRTRNAAMLRLSFSPNAGRRNSAKKGRMQPTNIQMA